MRRYLRHSPAATWSILPVTAVVFLTPWPWKIAPIIFMGVLVAVAATLMFFPRKCGHGRVSQGKFGLTFWGYALKNSPHCGAKEW